MRTPELRRRWDTAVVVAQVIAAMAGAGGHTITASQQARCARQLRNDLSIVAAVDPGREATLRSNVAELDHRQSTVCQVLDALDQVEETQTRTVGLDEREREMARFIEEERLRRRRELIERTPTPIAGVERKRDPERGRRR